MQLLCIILKWEKNGISFCCILLVFKPKDESSLAIRTYCFALFVRKDPLYVLLISCSTIRNTYRFEMLQNAIQKKNFIKKVITFEKLNDVDYKNKYIDARLVAPVALAPLAPLAPLAHASDSRK